MKALITAAALAALLVPSASALTVTIRSGQFQVSPGGEFVAVTSPTSFLANYDSDATQKVSVGGQQVVGFSTFCLEKDENLSTSGTYVGNLNDKALAGGVNTNSGDPISLGTAWLYSQFARGTLAGYAYGDPSGVPAYDAAEIAARKSSASALQNAFWILEDEQAAAANPFIALAAAALNTDLAGLKADANGAYGVKAINLFTRDGQYRQDILVLPDGGTTLVMLGGGVLGLALLRRRQIA